LKRRHKHNKKDKAFFVIVVHLFTCAYIVWVISPPCLLPSSVSGRSCSTLVTNFCDWLKKRHKHNKKDKALLLVELRIAIQKDSYYCCHVPMCYDPCWFNSNWSLHWFLIPC
jgi:hypothetical protein